jgi:hypothetical protein
MSFNNVEHFRQFLDEVNFEQQINDLKQSVWNEWIEQHLGEPEGDNGLSNDVDLTESYKSVYEQLDDAIFWNLIEYTYSQNNMLQRFDLAKTKWENEDREIFEQMKQYLKLQTIK